MSKDVKQQSNPFSTGGGGVNFETRVQAAFVISLLTHSCVPCLSQNMRAKELKFQNKYDGANTDDFVLIASDKVSVLALCKSIASSWFFTIGTCGSPRSV